jgi:hypothetical protein
MIHPVARFSLDLSPLFSLIRLFLPIHLIQSSSTINPSFLPFFYAPFPWLLNLPSPTLLDQNKAKANVTARLPPRSAPLFSSLGSQDCSRSSDRPNCNTLV